LPATRRAACVSPVAAWRMRSYTVSFCTAFSGGRRRARR
jgi:hypothetical protein